MHWPLLSYFGLACAISWTLWLPRIASEQGWVRPDVPEWWHYMGPAGPFVAALVVASRTEGRAGVRDLFRQFHPKRTAPGWMIFAVASPIILFVAASLASWTVGAGWPAYDAIAKTSNLPALGLPLTFLVHLVTFGLGEETGCWRLSSGTPCSIR